MQDPSYSVALDLLQPCAKLSMYTAVGAFRDLKKFVAWLYAYIIYNYKLRERYQREWNLYIPEGVKWSMFLVVVMGTRQKYV